MIQTGKMLGTILATSSSIYTSINTGVIVGVLVGALIITVAINPVLRGELSSCGRVGLVWFDFACLFNLLLYLLVTLDSLSYDIFMYIGVFKFLLQIPQLFFIFIELGFLNICLLSAILFVLFHIFRCKLCKLSGDNPLIFYFIVIIGLAVVLSYIYLNPAYVFIHHFNNPWLINKTKLEIRNLETTLAYYYKLRDEKIAKLRYSTGYDKRFMIQNLIEWENIIKARRDRLEYLRSTLRNLNMGRPKL